MKRHKVSGIAVTVAAMVLMAAISAVAQDQNMSAGGMSGPTSADTGGTGRAAHTGATSGNLLTYGYLENSTDGQFLMKAATGGTEEVEMARLALQKTASDAVRQFAQRMIDDQTRVNAQLMDLAGLKGMTPPTAPDARHQALMAKMQQLSGPDFDREYIRSSVVRDHEMTVKLFQNEANKGIDPDFKAFAAGHLPALQDHLRMARDLAAGRGGGGMSGHTSRRGMLDGANSGSASNPNH